MVPFTSLVKTVHTLANILFSFYQYTTILIIKKKEREKEKKGRTHLSTFHFIEYKSIATQRSCVLQKINDKFLGEYENEKEENNKIITLFKK